MLLGGIGPSTRIREATVNAANTTLNYHPANPPDLAGSHSIPDDELESMRPITGSARAGAPRVQGRNKRTPGRATGFQATARLSFSHHGPGTAR